MKSRETSIYGTVRRLNNVMVNGRASNKSPAAQRTGCWFSITKSITGCKKLMTGPRLSPIVLGMPKKMMKTLKAASAKQHAATIKNKSARALFILPMYSRYLPGIYGLIGEKCLTPDGYETRC